MSEAVSPILFVWGQFGPYHHDRCAAAGLAAGRPVIGVEVADGSAHHYAWEPVAAEGFVKKTLFPGKTYEEVACHRRFLALLREAVEARARHNFLCHYEKPEVFALALVLRLLRRRVFIMWETKFDDRPRRLRLEMLKWLFLRPYNGVLTSGARARGYLAFLGVGDRPIADGYDSVSSTRIRALAAGAESMPFGERPFVIVTRFVAKKNLPLAIAAYDLYRRRNRGRAHDLVLVGSGPLEGALKAEVKARGLVGVRFTGFLQPTEVARVLATSVALVLPSIEEQWGLVVNEALALGIPVLLSENAGARDLIRDGVNGYGFPSSDAERLMRLMEVVASDETRWRHLSDGARAAAPAGDAERFGEGVRSLIEACP